MSAFSIINKLPENFYTRDALIVARELLGKTFVRKFKDLYLAAKIVETEAYKGLNDQASHTFNGRTKRNEVMFNTGGHLYVYFTYGKHFCANVVTGKKDEGEAVLLRGFQPLNHIDILAHNRYSKSVITKKEEINISNGPAKICQSFKISRTDNGTDLSAEEIFIIDSEPLKKDQIVTTTRIGIKKSVDFPWRFYIKDNIYVSRK